MKTSVESNMPGCGVIVVIAGGMVLMFMLVGSAQSQGRPGDGGAGLVPFIMLIVGMIVFFCVKGSVGDTASSIPDASEELKEMKKNAKKYGKKNAKITQTIIDDNGPLPSTYIKKIQETEDED